MTRIRMWEAAEHLVAEVDGLLGGVRRVSPNAADHLLRSAEAVLYNVAEGVGAVRPKVKTTAYETARKEANEVRAILRRLVANRTLSRDQIRRPLNLASTVIAMLTKAMITLSRDS